MSQDLSPTEELVLEITTQTLSIISLFASLFIIISFIIIKNLRKHKSLKWIFFMALSDSLASIAYSLGRLTQLDNFPSQILCFIQAVMINCFELSSVLWAGAIATSLAILIIFPSRPKDLSYDNYIPNQNSNKNFSINNNTKNSLNKDTKLNEEHKQSTLDLSTISETDNFNKEDLENIESLQNINYTNNNRNNNSNKMKVDKNIVNSLKVNIDHGIADDSSEYESPIYSLHYIDNQFQNTEDNDHSSHIYDYTRNTFDESFTNQIAEEKRKNLSLPPIKTELNSKKNLNNLKNRLDILSNIKYDENSEESDSSTSTSGFELQDTHFQPRSSPLLKKFKNLLKNNIIPFIFISVCWCYPLVLTIVMIFAGVFGDSDSYCWIDKNLDRKTRTIWTMIAFYIPLWLCEIYIICIYAFIIIKIAWRWMIKSRIFHGDFAQEIAKQNMVVIFKLSLYPTILLIAYIFPTINRIHQFFGDTNFWLLFLHIIGSHSIGFLNAIVYGVTQNVFTNYVVACQNIKKKFRSNNKKENNRSKNEEKQVVNVNQTPDDEMVEVSLSD